MAFLEEDSVVERLRAPLLSTAGYAELALKLYRKKRKSLDARYEIVQPLGSFRVFSQIYEETKVLQRVVDWCHVSFLAKSIYFDCIDDTVLFMVELADFGFGDRLVLNYFKISKPDAPGLTYGCGFCPPNEDYPHIPGAHFAGRCDYKPTDDIFQEELAACFQRQVISKRKNKHFNPNYRPGKWPIAVNRDPSCFSLKLSDDEYAAIALSNINKVEEAEYELVHTLYSYGLIDEIPTYEYGHWCHVCFIAKPKNGDASLSPIHFFAELNDPGLRNFSLTGYSRFCPNVTKQGCGICPASKEYPHPRYEVSYIAGTLELLAIMLGSIAKSLVGE